MYLYTAHLNKKSQGAESQQNKNVFRSRLNSLRHMSRCRSSAGRLFHSRGPATAKLLSPSRVVWYKYGTRPEIRIFHYGQSPSLPLPSIPLSAFSSFPRLFPLPSPLPFLSPSPRAQRLNAARGSGGALKFPQRVRAEPGRQTGFGVFSATKSASGYQY